MSKNLTRKGIAFGALVALSLSAVAPANAAGMAEKTFVSLTPLTGTEYTVLSDQYIDLKATAASTISGTNNKDIKFLITDPSKLLRADSATTTKTAAATTTANTSVTASTGTAIGDTLTWVGTGAGTSGAKFVAGAATGTDAAVVNGSVFTQATNDTNATAPAATARSANGALTLTAQPTLEKIVGLSSRAVLATLPQTAIGAALEESSIASTYGPSSTALTNNRFTNGSFVINSETDDIGLARALRLVTTDSSKTYSFTVTAWSDDNDDNVIDSTEYTSEERTVTFQKAADLTVATAMTPIVADKNLTATVSTTPVLNGEQVLAQAGTFLNVGFSRQGSSVATMYGPTSAGATSAWDNTTKLFTVAVDLLPASGTGKSSTVASQTNAAWTGLSAPGSPTSTKIEISTGGVVTVTSAAHALVDGDKITMAVDTSANTNHDASVAIAAESTARTVTVTSVNTFTYSVSETTGLPTSAVTLNTPESGTEYTVATYGDSPAYKSGRVFAGTYTAQAYVGGTAIGNKVTATTATASSSKARIAATASASVQGKYFEATGSNTAYVKTGTLSVPVTVTVTDADGAAVSAGRPVVLTLSASGTTETFKVNGKATTDTLYTDANGVVTATITSVAGSNGSIVEVKAVAEGVASTDIDLNWANQAFSLVDLSVTDGAWTADGTSAADVTRTILEKGSYSLDLAVMDQWFTAPAADVYRLKVLGEGVPQAYVPLTSGKASVKITDSTVEGTTLDTDIILQKMSGTTVSSETTFDVATVLVKTAKVNAGADGSTLYSATAIDVSSPVAAKALVELDKRTSTTVVPAYANYVRLSGQIVDAATSAGLQGAVVTVSGASNILFADTATDNVYKRGSLTFVSNTASGANAGKWEILAYSTTSQTDSVITVTSNGVSSTVKVSFTGIGVGEGTSLSATAPTKVAAASTFQVTAKLADAYGNGVEATAGRVKVTYTGAGIVFGALPTSTDKNGALSFSALLGAADKGAVVVTVQYDQNGDADFVDAKDLTVTKTVLVAVSASTSAGVKKANVVVKNASGLTVTVVSGTKSVTKVATSNAYKVSLTKLTAGKKTVKVYVNDILVSSKSVTVKK